MKIKISVLAYFIVVSLSACGGEGASSAEGGVSAESATSGPSRSGPGVGSGCTANILNESTYDAIRFAALKSEVQQMINCKAAYSRADWDGTSHIEWYSEEDGRAQMSVGFDAQNKTYVKRFISIVVVMPASMPTPVSPACTMDHLSPQRVDLLAPEMTMDQVNRIIGCTPGKVDRLVSNNSGSVDATTTYEWGIYSDTSRSIAKRTVRVEFRDSTGLSIGIDANGLGNKVMEGSGNGSGCTANILNESTYDAIPLSVLKSESEQTISCKTLSYRMNADGTGYIWWDSDEFARATMTVSFDAQKKTYAKRYYGNVLTIPASMPTPVSPTCTRVDNINQPRRDLLKSGMTMDQVNQAIGCTPGRIQRWTEKSGELTNASTTYNWFIHDNSQFSTGDRGIKVEFRDDTGLSTSIDGYGL